MNAVAGGAERALPNQRACRADGTLSEGHRGSTCNRCRPGGATPGGQRDAAVPYGESWSSIGRGILM
jgi:hypothetical protein